MTFDARAALLPLHNTIWDTGADMRATMEEILKAHIQELPVEFKTADLVALVRKHDWLRLLPDDRLILKMPLSTCDDCGRPIAPDWTKLSEKDQMYHCPAPAACPDGEDDIREGCESGGYEPYREVISFLFALLDKERKGKKEAQREWAKRGAMGAFLLTGSGPQEALRRAEAYIKGALDEF